MEPDIKKHPLPHDHPGITVRVDGRHLYAGNPENPDQYTVQVWDRVCPTVQYNNLAITGGDELGLEIKICISPAGYGTVQYRYAPAGQNNFCPWVISALLSDGDLIEP